MVDHERASKTLVVTARPQGQVRRVWSASTRPQPGEPYTFHYQLVELSEDYMTPEGEEEKQPIAR